MFSEKISLAGSQVLHISLMCISQSSGQLVKDGRPMVIRGEKHRRAVTAMKRLHGEAVKGCTQSSFGPILYVTCGGAYMNL